jgi:glucuronoarabinoxylan endo-1,4-beta-xylanase
MVFPEDAAPCVVMISASKADGVVGTNPKLYHNIMNNNGTEHIWHELTDTGHDHTSVKPHLYNFLRMIFRDK